MSRIILSKYDNGQQKFVVGWDHPAQGAFWQEFNLEPDDWDNVPDGWEEVARYGGMWPGIPLANFKADVPEDLQPMVTDQVMELLYKAAEDPESGRWAPVDMSAEVPQKKE